MKLLITGAKGQLGSQIIELINRGKGEIGEIHSSLLKAEVSGMGKEDLDITELEDVKAYVKAFNPDVIINTAAYTNVDSCEKNEELAFKANSLGARNLAIAAEQVGAKLVHISTDYIFEGNGSKPYREYDVPSPVSIYGKTKLVGENYVKELCSRYFIIRTAWLYGYYGQNFVKTIITTAKGKGNVDVVDDQRGNPTNAEDLAYHILKIALTEEYGIYNCTGNGECSWYDFAKKIVEYAGVDCTVNPITSDKLVRIAKRPAYSSLDNMMLRCTVGDEMRQWQDALEMFVTKIKN